MRACTECTLCLPCSSGSSGSSGILPAPRTPSNHEQEGPRRALTPDAEARRVAEKLRDVKAERRKSRNLSVESLASEAGDDMECLRRENKKYAEELERIGADLAFVRSQVTLVSSSGQKRPRPSAKTAPALCREASKLGLDRAVPCTWLLLQSKELKDSNEQQTLEIQKLTEAASRVAALEEQNANQAVEIDRLLEAHTKLEQEAKAVLALREDNSQMEEDIFKCALALARVIQLRGSRGGLLHCASDGRDASAPRFRDSYSWHPPDRSSSMKCLRFTGWQTRSSASSLLRTRLLNWKVAWLPISRSWPSSTRSTTAPTAARWEGLCSAPLPVGRPLQLWKCKISLWCGARSPA